jgi:hypothetical protein
MALHFNNIQPDKRGIGLMKKTLLNEIWLSDGGIESKTNKSHCL